MPNKRKIQEKPPEPVDEGRHYRKIFEAGKKLIFHFGIKKVTVEEIAADAGISKVTFYKYFRNKDDLLAAIITEIVGESIRLTEEIMKRPVPYHEMLEEMLSLKFEYLKKYSLEFISDWLEKSPEIMKLLAEQYRRGYELTLELYNRGIKDGMIRPEISPELFNYYIFTSHKLFEDPALAVILPDPRDRIREISRYIFYGVMTINKGGRS